MRKKVLIVDDHELIFEGLKGQLDDLEMLFARNQKAVDDIIFDEEIPMAVIDISVGKENGFDIACRIRNHIPVIFFLSMHKSPPLYSKGH
ncbi:MAG: hypothetical protein B6241_11560 [Spirochaetaceae bacterium 4572_59]|nr:MAG: hypothetical protein B6241_11560 [Spirochaetaceae bacterium 4572_59]